MGGERDIDKFLQTQLLVFPKVAEAVIRAFEAQILPSVVKRLRRRIEVKTAMKAPSPDAGVASQTAALSVEIRAWLPVEC